MKLSNQIMNLPCRREDYDFVNTKDRLLYKEGHRDARHDACDIIAEHESTQLEHDKETLSIILWLLRRLPRCYGLPPHVEPEILRLSGLTGINCAEELNERIVK